MRTVPPVGVYCVAGCGADLLINICLTLLGYFPGHLQYVVFLAPLASRTNPRRLLADLCSSAFYVEYVYYRRKEEARDGVYDSRPAPGVYSDNVQTGGHGYGTMAPPAGR